MSIYPWAELAVLAVLEAEFTNEEEIQEAQELENAMVASISGVILSWEEICNLSGEEDKGRYFIPPLQARFDDR